jgi:hypothetical protein
MWDEIAIEIEAEREQENAAFDELIERLTLEQTICRTAKGKGSAKENSAEY